MKTGKLMDNFEISGPLQTLIEVLEDSLLAIGICLIIVLFEMASLSGLMIGILSVVFIALHIFMKRKRPGFKKMLEVQANIFNSRIDRIEKILGEDVVGGV